MSFENLSEDEIKKILADHESHKALEQECQEQGIPIDSVNYYWYKSQKFSINAKTDEFNRQRFLDQITETVKKHAPTQPKIKYKKNDSQHLLVINPADIHIGKYASKIETGEDYNIEIAKQRVTEGVQGIVELAAGFPIDRILFAIGNDVLHVDNVYNTTTKGTRQDVIGKWHEHFNQALELYIWCVEYLRTIAPVDAIHSMSNHDYQSGFHLAHTLKAYFNKDKNVVVDAKPQHRKYYKYGNSLIGFSHGDGAKTHDLPLIMASEQKQSWSETKHRYWYLHHVHHRMKYKWLDAKDYHGCTVEFMRSPSADDSWHNRKGYTATPKGVQGHIHHKTHGQIARLDYIF
jgi:hypothetical protein